MHRLVLPPTVDEYLWNEAECVADYTNPAGNASLKTNQLRRNQQSNLQRKQQSSIDKKSLIKVSTKSRTATPLRVAMSIASAKSRISKKSNNESDSNESKTAATKIAPKAEQQHI